MYFEICSLARGRYPSDDINKFLWMVRIGGGVYPEIKEKDYLGGGQYRIDGQVTKVRNALQHPSDSFPGAHLADAAHSTLLYLLCLTSHRSTIFQSFANHRYIGLYSL